MNPAHPRSSPAPPKDIVPADFVVVGGAAPDLSDTEIALKATVIARPAERLAEHIGSSLGRVGVADRL